MHKEIYENPLCGRYASKEMQRIFSPDNKFSTWRRLWIALAESEKELGLAITDAQIEEMKQHIDDIDYDKAADYEKKLRHDVMAHIHTYAELCPTAAPIIHLGATSCFVGDNTDILQMKEGLLQIKKLLVSLMRTLADFAEREKDTPTLAYTHFQAAQPTTVGKRACLWLQDFLMDYERLEFELAHLKLLGCKGTTGTGASFLELFEGDQDKVRELERKIAAKMGFEACMPVSGQTYSRKVDNFVLQVLSGIAQSASKMGVDLRLMAHMKEFDEPFESGQVGSSAMAYKRNPMRSERIVSLSRYIINCTGNTADTAANQWLERTLGRLREPPNYNTGNFPGCRRHPFSGDQRYRRGNGLRQGYGEASAGGAAVHRDREHPHGRGQPRWRPAGIARDHPAVFSGGGKGCQGGGQ